MEREGGKENVREEWELERRLQLSRHACQLIATAEVLLLVKLSRQCVYS